MRRTGARLDLLEREAADTGSGVRLECVVLRSRPESDEALRLQGESQSDVRSAWPDAHQREARILQTGLDSGVADTDRIVSVAGVGDACVLRT